MSLKAAWALLVAMSLIGLVVLLQLDRTAQIVALASLAPVAAYPFMKRITWWPQAWLGLVFSWGALVGWPAVKGHLDAPAWWLWAGSIFWVIGYDTIYALQDKEDDALVGVRSSALALGQICPARRRALLPDRARPVGGLAPSGAAANGSPCSALLPIALHLLWQAATLRPDDGDDALAKFRSNRTAGLPHVPRLPGRRQRLRLLLNAEPLPRAHARRP